MHDCMPFTNWGPEGSTGPVIPRRAAHVPHKTAMRAFVVSEYAHPSKIQLTHNAPEPDRKPGSDELLIDVHSAGLNFFDVRFPRCVRPTADTHPL